MSEFSSVAQQVLILFVFVAVGFILGKTRVLSEGGAHGVTEIVLLVVTPCLIVTSFMRDIGSAMFVKLGLMALAAAGSLGLNILAARLLLRDKDTARERVLRFGAVFSNCGFMALPLQQALLGDDGVLLGAVFIVVFNLVQWSYGVFEMTRDRRALSPKKILFTPGLIGLVAGLAVFFLRVPLLHLAAQLPLLTWAAPVFTSPVRALAALNTPLAMTVVGYHLSTAPLRRVLTEKRAYAVAALRLLALPLVSLGLLYLCGARGLLLIACMIPVSAPCAAATTMFAARYGQDAQLSVRLVSLTTLLSMVTMPCLVVLTKLIA
ncbi:MAG: AEC family transporter [Oscillospiraceae bacterium]|nr:AEC family transporter [Oscillospiraceae bacterium]